MDESIEDRLAAVERALTDGDHDLSALADDGETAARIERVEATIDELDDRIGELEAATQALRGYVGNVRAVNEEVRERADLALEVAERAEQSQRPARDESAAATPEADDASARTDEPTIELATDDHSPRGTTTERTPAPQQTRNRRETRSERAHATTDRCPLCEDNGQSRHGTDELGPPSGSDSRRSEERHGITDGGAMADGTADDDETVLTRIRALL